MAEPKKPRVRYLFRREREDGTVNETINLINFEKWLSDATDSDKFQVAKLEWVEAEVDGSVVFGAKQLPHVRYVEHVDAKENW